MYFYQVFLKNVQACYTWHAQSTIPIGTRVRVNFRNKPKIGIIVSRVTETPTFKTNAIQETLRHWSLSEVHVNNAKSLAKQYFVPLGKILTLMVPEAFLQESNPVQRAVFYTFTAPKNVLRGKNQQAIAHLFSKHKQVTESDLKAVASMQTIKNLQQKNILQKHFGGIAVPLIETFAGNNFELTPVQQSAFDALKASKKPCLLWGVTGSGKTEIYKKLAQSVTGQTLFLLPEIALTPQLIGQFQALFGTKVGVWHSKLSRREKIQTWARVQTKEITVLIGTRSGALIPMPELDLVILDEEHEWTFKNEFAPRYWTHDLVEILSKNQSAKLLFGSATPRIESILKTQKDVWELVSLNTTVHENIKPKFHIVDLKQEQKKGNYSPLSETLVQKIEQTITQNEQVVLFLNKRGYAGASMCKSCGEYFECPDCSQNMKFHTNQRVSKLVCHICGYLQNFPTQCPHCNAKDFLFKGWGTQQVEAAVKKQIPSAKVLRADADSVKGKHDFKKIWQNFRDKKFNVLIGTQMIAKGLDFESVTFVGIILADVGLSLPDYRSEERVFQLLSQVSGRAGRRKKQGTIVLQTFRPDEPVFKYLVTNNAKGFYEYEALNRKNFLAPPFSVFAKITISDANKSLAFKKAQSVFEQLKKAKDNQNVLQIYMAPAFFPRSHNQYHFHVFVQAKTRQELVYFLQICPVVFEYKVDIKPSSLL